jgi:hypothetical protein
VKIVIVTSCSSSKTVDDPNRLTFADFAAGKAHVEARETELADFLTPAEDLYDGLQHRRLMGGIRYARQHPAKEIEIVLHIVSAGYGVIDSARKVAPYELTFKGMSATGLRMWADRLGVPRDFRAALSTHYELGLVLLGSNYLQACGISKDLLLGGRTIFLSSKNVATMVQQIPDAVCWPLTNADARTLGTPLVGLKGEIARRLLVAFADNTQRRIPASLEELMALELSASVSGAPIATAPIGLTVTGRRPVDTVITLNDSWRKKSSQRQLKYFIPEWDDLVDADFDFQSDTHSGGTGDWSNEVYAHQLLPEPSYDGLLMSRVRYENTRRKKDRIEQFGVHRYLRVPKDFPVMGDCGAFGYINNAEPPFKTDEVADYYSRLGFDYGVSIDHLIVTETDNDRSARYELTLDNAADMLRIHGGNHKWTPIGAIQGWDTDSYATAARRVASMGYKYIGIGGLVRTRTRQVLQVLEAVRAEVSADVSFHLFGLARLVAIPRMAELGVVSVDSASPLRRAWLGSNKNYLALDGEWYAAVRIPEVGKSFRAKRIVSDGRATPTEISQLERDCLAAMRAYARREIAVDEAVALIDQYDRLITPDRPVNTPALRRTLEARPWEYCPCAICSSAGIEVIIFRGNNRNRRRGFHNTYVFHQLLDAALEQRDEATSVPRTGLLW